MSGFNRVVCFVVSIGVAMGAWMASVAAQGQEEDEEGVEVLHHEVEEDETLGTVALEYEANILELMEWNELDSVHDVEPDDELEIPIDEELTNSSQPQATVHVVSPGDTLEDIARRYGVRLSQVRQWNGGVDPRRLQIGQRIHLNVPSGDGPPVSWGSPSSGRLFNGLAMECSPGLRVRNQARSYGTHRTINLLKAAAADVQARWPDAPELVVGSLSSRNGGPMRPHRSHQNGRDADLSYYHRGNVELPDFRDMTPEMFDAVKNWHFFKTLIETGEVQFIFVDYQLQKVLYEYARSIGYSEEDLSDILQYPRGSRAAVGVIRHSRGHQNHFHIRFKCGDLDQNCR